MTAPAGAVPLLGDLPLMAVQHIEHVLDGGHVGIPVIGLAGDVQQRTSRRSHRIRMRTELVGPQARAELERLQTAAAAGDEVTFAADITTALTLGRVVITHLRAVEVAGMPDRFQVDVELVESPPLPPPAQLDPLGGLGDLGIDPGVLDDIGALGAEIAGAVDTVLDTVSKLEALSALADLAVPSTDGLLGPLFRQLGDASTGSEQLGDAAAKLAAAFGAPT
jgi:hypothetical protein